MLPSKGVGLRILNEVVADFWELHDVHGRDCITTSTANYRDFSVHGIFPSLGFGLIQVHFSLCFSNPA